MLSSNFETNFKPDLGDIQRLEEARISFQKFCLDKYIHTLTVIGQTTNFVTS
jgi:hypothetical protein